MKSVISDVANKRLAKNLKDNLGGDMFIGGLKSSGIFLEKEKAAHISVV